MSTVRRAVRSTVRPVLMMLVALLVGVATALAVPSAWAAEQAVNLAPEAEPSAEYTAPWNSLAALNDGAGVTTGGSHGAVWGSYDGERPATRWIQYAWTEPVTLTSTEVLFWHDAQPGTGDNVAVPAAWSMTYWDEVAQDWKPVTGASPFETQADVANRTTFDPVTTNRVRVILEAAPGSADPAAHSAVAVSEWRVLGTRSEDPPPGEDEPIAVDAVHVPTTVGTAPLLPATIAVTRLDGLRDDVAVAWDAIAPTAYDQPGSFDVSGVADTVAARVTATVWVRPVGEDGGAVVAIDPSSALTVAGTAPELPDHVTAELADGTRDSSYAVTWRPVEPAEYATEGIVEVSGVVTGTPIEAALVLIVDAPAPTEDTVPPTLSVTVDPERPSTGWWTAAPSASFAASDAMDAAPVIEYRLDGGAWTPSAGPVTVDGDGEHELGVRATDASGNVSAEQVVEIGLDTTAPAVTPSVTKTAQQVTITLDATDATSGVAAVQYAVGDEFEATYQGPIVVDRTAVAQTVRFTSTDHAGHRSAPQTVAVPALGDPASDLVAPEVTLSVSPAQPDGLDGWWRSAVRVSASASDDTDPAPDVEIRVDDGAWTPATGLVTLEQDGRHSVRARATDAAGNVSVEQLSGIGIDTVAPEVTSSISTTAAQVTITLDATDATSGVAGVQYAVGAGGEATYQRPIVVERTQVTRTVRFTATDRAGHRSTQRTITVPALAPPATDDTAPRVTVSTSPARADGLNGWWRTTVRVSATATDETDTSPDVEISVDGSAWVPATGPVALAREGRHAVRVRATDAAGNVSAVLRRTIGLDHTGPEVRSTVSQQARAVTLRATDALAGVDRVRYRIGDGAWRTYRTPVRVGPGRTRVRFRAVDRAGNVTPVKGVVVPARRTR